MDSRLVQPSSHDNQNEPYYDERDFIMGDIAEENAQIPTVDRQLVYRSENHQILLPDQKVVSSSRAQSRKLKIESQSETLQKQKEIAHKLHRIV